MIYLIGGPPKCGKTSLAKKLSKKLEIPWVASDTLEVVAMDYVWKYAAKKFDALYPHSSMKGDTNDETYTAYSPLQIAKNYLRQAKATYAAIDMFSICEIKDGNNYIIEGYHITPELAARLTKQYGKKNFKVLFLGQGDDNSLVRSFEKSTTPNDWIIERTKKPGVTYPKIAKMISNFSKITASESKKYGFKYLETGGNFQKQLDQASKLLTS
jgi:2-phosphoglycerate kinase